MVEPYPDRVAAGQLLAQSLMGFRDRPDALVVGLPRGGVPVAFQVARTLHLPLDVCIVRKLGLPGYEELAMGALAQGNGIVFNPEILEAYHPGQRAIAQVIEREQLELHRRERAFREGRGPLEVKGRTVILVDDGLATGATMRAAVQSLRTQDPAAIIVAVPVGAPDTCEALAREVDLLVCPRRPASFSAIGQWYEDFRQTSDGEVRALLKGDGPPLGAEAEIRLRES